MKKGKAFVSSPFLKVSKLQTLRIEICGVTNFRELAGWQYRIGKIGIFGSASANFPIERNSVGRAVKLCRQNWEPGRIGESASFGGSENRGPRQNPQSWKISLGSGIGRRRLEKFLSDLQTRIYCEIAKLLN